VFRVLGVLNEKQGAAIIVPGVLKVEVYVFRQGKCGVEYLLLKRSPELGGYWQPITGSVEQNETLADAAVREACEEVGASPVCSLVGPVHRFRYEKNGVEFEEHVFGLEVSEPSVLLSREHTEWKWLTHEEALASLKWNANRDGLRMLHAELVTRR
jgi:dATP pyrophosphohydrolase